MAERKHLTLIYRYDENWIGGTYYILNIIKVLNMLDDIDKPQITIIYDNEESINVIGKLNYPYINFQFNSFQLSFFKKISNKVFWNLFGTFLFKIKVTNNVIQNLYPVFTNIDTSNVEHFHFWLPDFQEHHLSYLFSKREIRSRVNVQKLIRKSGQPVVFSSNDALNDYNRLYPDNQNKKKVLNFVSIVDEAYKKISIERLRIKYNITKQYFIVPNQFWQHKNQFIVIKAALILSELNVDFQIVFTGKEHDPRNPKYIIDLKKYVTDNKLENYVSFLGFIDRNEQLQLMKNSVAIIQPSLFEGWSTVVEDSKAIEQFIILSDIPLHREQITDNCLFFDPRNEHQLVEKINTVLNNGTILIGNDYKLVQLEAARNILDLII